jgi:hypothetical protein
MAASHSEARVRKLKAQKLRSSEAQKLRSSEAQSLELELTLEFAMPASNTILKTR